MSKVFVCAQLHNVKNIYGGYDCKQWVLQNASVFDEFKLTYEEYQFISMHCAIIFTTFIVFVITAKAIKII